MYRGVKLNTVGMVCLLSDGEQSRRQPYTLPVRGLLFAVKYESRDHTHN